MLGVAGFPHVLKRESICGSDRGASGSAAAGWARGLTVLDISLLGHESRFEKITAKIKHSNRFSTLCVGVHAANVVALL